MAISREKKEKLVAQYTEDCARSGALIFTSYQGLSMPELTRVRRKLKEVDSVYRVVKNTLFRRALEKAGLPIPEELINGPIAITFCFQDVVASAKILAEFSRELEGLSIKGALLGERVLDAKAVKTLTTLPSRDQLLAQVLAGLQAPISGLVNVLSGPLRGLVYVLKARADQLSAAPS